MLNLSINTQGFNSFSRKVSPFLMFNNGAEGGLYPISDLKRQGRLYTDSALSTVITDAGDPLGGAEDLSGNSNPLTQATDTDRPVYGIVPFGGRRNLLTHTEELTHLDWDLSEMSVTATEVEDPFGGHRATELTAVDDDANLRYPISLIDAQTYTTSIYLRVPTGSLTTRIYFVGNINQLDEVTITGEWTRFPVTKTADGVSRIQFGGGNTISSGQVLEVAFPQLEEGTEATPYQKVVTQYEVTESGKPTAHVLHFNGTNQEIGSDYPAGTYTICLAGINGAWFDEIDHAGGAFDLGPTTFSSTNPDTDPDAPDRLYGPEGILEVVGNVVAFIPMEGSISAAQKARLLQYLKQLGCPGEITLGPEIVTNGTFDTDVSGWTENVGTFSWDSGGVARLTSDPGDGSVKFASQGVTLQANEKYILAGDLRVGNTADHAYIGSVGADQGSYLFNTNSDDFVNLSAVFSRTAGGSVSIRPRVDTGTDGNFAEFDNVSVRKLEFPA